MGLKAFHVWRQRRHQRMQQRKHLLIAQQYSDLSLLSMYFMYWQIGARALQREKHMKRLSLGFWAHKRLSLSWMAWKKVVDLCRTILLMSERRDRRLVASMFKRWHCNTIEDMGFRRAKRRLEAAAMEHLRRMLMRASLRRWHQYVMFKKRKDRATSIYKESLCSRCMNIWKGLLLSKGVVCGCDEEEFSQGQGLGKVSELVALLRSQNRLLRWRQSSSTKAKRSRRLSQKKQSNTSSISCVCSFLKECIPELKSMAVKYLEQANARRCCNWTEPPCGSFKHIDKGTLSKRQDSAIDDTAGDNGSPVNNEGQSMVDLTAQPLMSQATIRTQVDVDEESCFKAYTNLEPAIDWRSPSKKRSMVQYSRSILASSRGSFSRRNRLPPRRPLYLHGSPSAQRQLSDPKLIKEELNWTEDLLCNFSRLEEELRQQELELSVLRERHNSGDRFQAEKIRLLEGKILILHERRALLKPIVEGLTSRASALHKCFRSTSQVLHLD